MRNCRLFILCGVLILIMVFTSCTVNNNTVEESLSSKSEVNIIPERSDDDMQRKTEFNKKLHDFYVEYIERYSSPQEIHYDIYDLDGDDIPELIISEGYFHAAGCRIYSYVNSELRELGRLGEWGTFLFYPESNLILWSWTNQGHHIEKWYEIKDHEMNLLYSYGFLVTGKDQQQYEINGESADKEEYNEYLKVHSDKRPKKDEKEIELGKRKVYQE